MPANAAVATSGTSGPAVTPTEVPPLASRGRKRYCRKCTFSCTDARQFTAHQLSHSASADRAISAAQSQRVLRPKRNSKGSAAEADSEAAMEVVSAVVGVGHPLTSGLKKLDSFLCHPDPLTFKVKKEATDETPAMNSLSESSLNTSTEHEEELVDAVNDDDDDDEDEPDAMTVLTGANNLQRDFVEKRQLLGDRTDIGSAEEDGDEDRLIIDDEGLVKNGLTRRGDAQTRKYSCEHCDMTTTSAKAYLQHLNEKHTTEVRTYECDLCEYDTVYKHKLAKHRKQHFLVENSETPSAVPDAVPQLKLEDRNTFMMFPPNSTALRLTPSFLTPAVEVMEDDDEEDDDDTSTTDHGSTPIPLTITPENIDQVLDEDKKKKKKTRQEVDPGKYFEAVDSSGTKYACSQCGNIYKWRKSLNKHWKEKHSLDPLVEVASPPGMLELLKSGKYTQLGARRIYDKTFLATIKTSKSDDPSAVASHILAQSPSPPNFLSSTPTVSGTSSRLTSPSRSLIPKMIGPFIANTAQPVFPGMPMTLPHLPQQGNSYDSPDEGALDLTRDMKISPKTSPFLKSSRMEPKKMNFDEEQPLDLSRSNKVQAIKTEKPWEEVPALKPAHSINQLILRLHHCSKCDFTSSSEVEFANHTSTHLNKRIVRCYECKIQLNSMDELNNHFIKLHFRKLTDYKEAIKKIPHGLQQTYHLLNMEIQDIGELGNQDLGAAEGKSLKCKKCDFEAKWPAELQKHAVSHSEERPYICMVCGSTYKWKWDLVKHFQKSHPNLPNPYRRNDKKDTTDGSSEEEDEPIVKRAKIEVGNLSNGDMFSRDDNITVEGIIAATQAGQKLISSQPNILDDEPSMDRNPSFITSFQFMSANNISQMTPMERMEMAHSAQELERINKVQKAMQEVARNRQNSSSSSTSSNGGLIKKNSGSDSCTSSPSPGASKSEELPYKCTMCNYHARWPSEVTQHMKNHSDSKPYLCPKCEYRSKWKWDVVKHLKRCGGGGINDVIDTTKSKKKDALVSHGPPNAIVSQQGKVKKMTPQPTLSYPHPSLDDKSQQSMLSQQSMMMDTSGHNQSSDMSSEDDQSQSSTGYAHDLSSSCTNNNNSLSVNEQNVNNNYAAYTNGLPFNGLNSLIPTVSASAAAVNILCMNSNHSSNNSPSQSPTPSTLQQQQHTASSRHTGETWNCPHCPFTTQSQAEHKRHSGIHLDDKPFKCDVCQYSTRWACDLKKHRKSYNHFPKSTTPRDDKEKIQTQTQAPEGRFRCSECSIFFKSLQSLLDHRQAEHARRDSGQNSPAPPSEIEMDAARIKHPRKQVKKIECSKCQFVCKSRQTMERHLDEHEQLERYGIPCTYCQSIFKDKESLLDHLTSHAAFNPKEWETFFMINEDDQYHQRENGKIFARKDFKNQQNSANKSELMLSNLAFPRKVAENDKLKSDCTEARIHQILNEVIKQMTTTTSKPAVPIVNNYKCEWCTAEFVNLTAIYNHAREAHPIELKEQDVRMLMTAQCNSPQL